MRSSSGPALVVFVTCVVARVFLQKYGGPDVGDLNWITTFGVVGASWLGLSNKINNVNEKAEQITKQTNGILSKKITEIVHEAMAQERMKNDQHSEDHRKPDSR